MEDGWPDTRRSSATSPVRRVLRLTVSVLVLACALVAAVRTDLIGSLSAARDLDPTMMVVASVATLTAVVNRGFLNYQSRRLHGVHLPLRVEIRMSAAALALNKVVKSGGLAGLAFYIRRARADGAPAAAVTRAFVVVGAAAHVALAGLAVTTLLIAPRDELPIAGAFSDMAVGSVGAVALAVVLGVFLTGVVTGHSGLGTTQVAAGALRIVLHAGVNKLLGVCTLAAVLAAAGAEVAFTTVVLVYATALVSGALSIIPAGVGVVEASTVAVLTASGVEPGTALVAVLAFRLFDLWVPVAVGWVLARRLDIEPDPAPVGIGADLPLVPAPLAVAVVPATVTLGAASRA